jgi:hypothetical protein
MISSRAVAVSASRNFLAIFWLKSSLEIQSQMAKGKLDPIEGVRGTYCGALKSQC